MALTRALEISPAVVKRIEVRRRKAIRSLLEWVRSGTSEPLASVCARMGSSFNLALRYSREPAVMDAVRAATQRNATLGMKLAVDECVARVATGDMNNADLVRAGDFLGKVAADGYRKEAAGGNGVHFGFTVQLPPNLHTGPDTVRIAHVEKASVLLGGLVGGGHKGEEDAEHVG